MSFAAISRKKFEAVLFFIGLLVISYSIASFALAGSVLSTHNTGHCGSTTPVEKDDAPTPFISDGTNVITSVWIKAGKGCFEFTTNSTDGCYTVTGLGTTTVTVSGGGTSSTCKSISHVEYYAGTPTLTPTPTPTDEPSPTPTEEPSPTPTEEPSPTPTEEPSPTPTEEPSPTPTETQEEPTLTPTEGPTPTSTPTPTPTGSVSGTSTSSSPSDPGDPGTSQGQVLGASTLAATGKTGDIVLSLGLILTGLGLYGFSARKAFKKS